MSSSTDPEERKSAQEITLMVIQKSIKQLQDEVKKVGEQNFVFEYMFVNLSK